MKKVVGLLAQVFDYVFLTVWSWLEIRGDTALERELTAAIVVAMPLLVVIGTIVGMSDPEGESILSHRLVGTLLVGVPVGVAIAVIGVLRSRRIPSSRRFELLKETSNTILRSVIVSTYFLSALVFLLLATSD